MRHSNFWIFMAMLHWTVGQMDAPAPSCAVHCWENTKYVSKCLDDNTCRCSESEYQNSLLQCLYSQCETADFTSALHHTTSQCPSTDSEILVVMPQVSNHDALRRREAEYLAGAIVYGSGSSFGFPTESSGFLTQSVNYPTQSANYPTQSVAAPYSPNPTSPSNPPYFPLNIATGPQTTSASPTETYSTVATSATAEQLTYAGAAPEIRYSISLPVVASVVALYLAL